MPSMRPQINKGVKMISLQEYQKVLRKYSITDCAIRTKDIFMFIGSEILTDEEIEEYDEGNYNLATRPKRVITFFQEPFEDGRQWFHTDLIGWRTCRIGATNHPKSHSITIANDDLENRVYVTGSGPAHEDTRIQSTARGGVNRGAITRLKTIDGWLYFCGGNRTVAKRLDESSWISLVNTLPDLETGDMLRDITEAGFSDIDGFSENDLYAAGGHGDVWHFNGEQWRAIVFPSNQTLESLCCGGDGKVYISGYGAETYMGRDNKWKKIYSGGISTGFRDMVWFGDRVWCTNDYGVWTIYKGKVKRADLPATIEACAGHLHVNDGVMLLAGLSGAAFCEDGKWTLLFNSFTMNKLVEVDEHEG